MFNDVCTEYMVKKKNSVFDWIKQIGIILLSIIVAAFIIRFVTFNESDIIRSFMGIGYIIALGIMYLGYKVSCNMSLEYEYILTNGDMDIDKISARSTRKRVVSLKCNEFESFGKYTKGLENGKNFENKIVACDSVDSKDVYYCISKSAKYGKVFVIFNANDKMLKAMKPFISKEFRV